MITKAQQLGIRKKTEKGWKGNISTRIGTRKKEARNAIHEFIRERDKILRDGRCITCGKKCDGDAEAGHYHHGILEDERNIHLQCTHCNKYLSGNRDHYYVAMKKMFGEEVADYYLNISVPVQKYKWYELYEIEKKYKMKLEKLKECEPCWFRENYNYTDSWLVQ